MPPFDYESDKRRIVKRFSLGYDMQARGDLDIRYVRLDTGEEYVILYQEPDKPFARGFVREQIPKEKFAMRFVNGLSLAELIGQKITPDGSEHGS